MRSVPWWTVLSATLAPVFLIGGWSLAANLQPDGYDPVRDTISALAGLGATDRWVMTLGLAGLGGCHVITAAGLRAVHPYSRMVLALGGVATASVAALPLPRVGSSGAHGIVAGIAFIALALWPVLGHRRAAGIVASVVLVALLTWFAIELYGDGGWIGRTERLVAGAEAICPLIAVITLIWRVGWRRRGEPPGYRATLS